MATKATLNVTVVFGAGARRTREAQLSVTQGTSAAQAIRQSGLLTEVAESEIDTLQIAVWGKKVNAVYLLRDNDRLELCRPLRVDPKVARRERFQRQGAKTAGLFSHRRTGSKAGY